MSSISNQINTLNQLNQNFFQPLSTVQEGQKVRIFGDGEDLSNLSLKVENTLSGKFRGVMNILPGTGKGTLTVLSKAIDGVIDAASKIYKKDILAFNELATLQENLVDIPQTKLALENIKTSLNASLQALLNLSKTYTDEKDSGKHMAEDRLKLIEEKRRIEELIPLIDEVIQKFPQS